LGVLQLALGLVVGSSLGHFANRLDRV
ncbi:MAG: hypothetical protein RLZZ56_995, partial [Actinomycetota bacterium]